MSTSLSLVDALCGAVGTANVLSGDELTGSYTRDWTGRWSGSTPCVVLPTSPVALASAVAVLAAHRVSFVPQGGNTGLVGGATPLGGEVVVSTRRLAGIVALDSDRGEVVVRAGTTLAQLQKAVGAHGWELPIDYAARDEATVGGMVATDAAGLRALRHGRMRGSVLGLDVVLPTGARLDRLGRVPKDGTGYDLVGLVVGSEGTLGVVSQARLRLVRPPRERATALVALAGVEDAVALTLRALGDLSALESCELVEAEGVELVAERSATHPPLAGRALLLLECASDAACSSELRGFLASAPEVRGVLLAADPAERRELWSWREGVPAAVAASGAVHKLDVGVGLADVAPLLDEVRAAVTELSRDARLVAFGHLGEGNLHLNVLGCPFDDDRVDAAVLSLVAARGGSIAAEHGVGRAKAAYVHLGRTAADVTAMRAIKQAVDPDGLANPGVIFPVDGGDRDAPDGSRAHGGPAGAASTRW